VSDGPLQGVITRPATQVSLIPVLNDNYVFVLHGAGSGTSGGAKGQAVLVDPAVADPVVAWLEQRQLEPVAVLHTHHHHDHIGGTPELLGRWPQLQVIAAAADRQRIPFQTQGVGDGDRLTLLGRSIQVLAMPGHTRAHIAFYLPPVDGQPVDLPSTDGPLNTPSFGELFCGDTLFAGGCGRLLEGSPEQLWQSLQRLAALPVATRIWCSHEYTEANLRWAQHLHPDDQAIHRRFQQVLAERATGQPTIPSSIGEELLSNLFMRSRDVAEFTRYRHSKDHWRG
jgi:hydroxyacylglutathione hydrolase